MQTKGLSTAWLVVVLLFILSPLTGIFSILAQTEDLIEDIEIRGNRRVPADTVKFHILSQKNTKLDPAVLQRDFKAVWAMSFFDDLKIEIEDGKTGKIVIFWVKERPLIREIKYVGLKSATNTEVLDKYKEKKVGLGMETPFEPTKVQRAITVLTELLAEKGRQYAKITYDAKDSPPNGKILTFYIEEGPKVKVEKIDFHGNTVYSDKQLKKSMKYIKETGLISMFTGKSTYDQQKLEGSLELGVRAKYQEKGYIKLLIKDPKIDIRDVSHTSLFPIPFQTKKGKRVFIDIDLEEGPQYRVGEVNFTGNTQFRKEILQRVLGVQQGEVFNGEMVRKGFENLKKIYGAKGFINWTPVPRQELDDENRLVNIVFEFEEGKQFYLRRLDFVGNTTTRDKVIRREVLVNEGEIYNTQLLDISLLRLNQLGFFDTLKQEDADVKPDLKAAGPEGENTGWVDVTLKVKEKGKNSIGFSGGVSGYGGSFVGVNYSTNNFLGYGETLDFTIQGGTRQSAYIFSFTEPYFKDRPITTGFSLYHRRYSYREGDQYANYLYGYGYGYGAGGQPLVPLGNEIFAQSSNGFTIFASKPIRPFTRFGLSYGIDRSSTTFANSDYQLFYTAFQFTDTFSGIGSYTGVMRSTITPSLTYSTINNPFTPTSGKSYSALFQFTGGPVSDVKYYKPYLEAKWFHPMNKHRNTLGMRAQFAFISGYGGLSAPITDRWFTGGEDSIRGFDIRSISPRALVTTKTLTAVTQRDPYGNPVIDPTTGSPIVNYVPFYNSFPYYIGGDTQVIYNIEYRIPIIGNSFSIAPFFDVGKLWVLKESQIRVAPQAASQFYVYENGQFSPMKPGTPLPVIPETLMVRSSTGVEFQVILPVVNAPFRLIYYYNPNQLDTYILRPEGGLPYPLFDNYDSNGAQKRHGFRFSVGRTF
ncbi:MAG TPA: outer membrane protein assembly factor BamA [Terriglobia bacterium]|nr:outer membrane protein assembly factor BamA [Terriglobia bacterium]